MITKKIASTLKDYKYISSLFNPKNTEFFQTKEISVKRLQEIAKSFGRKDYIILRGDKNIGWFHITNCANPDDGITIGIIIDSPYRNKGYGHIAMELINQEAIRLGKRKISLKVFAENKQAINVYESAGFEKKEHQITMEKYL